MSEHSRDRAIQWARGILKLGNQAVILDTETTGLDGSAEVVQVAIIDMTGEVLFESLIKPHLPISAEVSAINGITNEMLKDALPFAKVYPFFQPLLGRYVVIYNANYDVRLLEQSALFAHMTSLPFIPNPIDAMQPYAEFVGDWNPRRGSYRWQPLPAGDHTAAGDCKATLALIRRMAEAVLSADEVQNA